MNKAKIIISSNSGFCFGVQRALGIAKRALKEKKTVYSLGPIIHNPQVVDEFSKKGLLIVKDVKTVRAKNAAFLVPSHGISPDRVRNKKFDLIDTTCPLVGRVQKIIKDLKARGFFIVIVGNKKHPEVRGLVGIAGSASCAVVKDRSEAKSISIKRKKIALISQTTAPLSNFKEVLSEIAKKDITEFTSINTVCKNTIERQKEACDIARRVDAMVVIGGKQSANTSKLAASCRRANRNTHHIESKDDLRMSFFKGKKSVGIVSGASTPPYAIREVIKKIRRFEI